jgi:hypothetical protein
MLLLGEAMKKERLRAVSDLNDIAVQQRHRGLRELYLLLQRNVLAGLVDRVDHQHAVDQQAPALALRRRQIFLKKSTVIK